MVTVKLRGVITTVDPIAKKLHRHDEELEELLAGWGFGRGSTQWLDKKATIHRWFRNFKPREFEDALLILQALDYHDGNRVREHISVLSRRLKGQFGQEMTAIRFASLDPSPSSSGALFLYDFRKELGVEEASFIRSAADLKTAGTSTLVVFDDMIGSGKQALRYFRRYLSDIPVDVYYVALLAFESGLHKVLNSGRFKEVMVATVLTEDYKPFESTQVFPEANVRERIRRMCEEYGKDLYPRHPLGWDDSQALVVFPHNTPNNTLPIIWAGEGNEASTEEWNPVWPRRKASKGIGTPQARGALTPKHSPRGKSVAHTSRGILEEAFFTLEQAPSASEIADTVGRAWSIDEPMEVSPILTAAELDQPLRNSNRWLLRGREDYFLRQLLRKVPADPGRMASKHALLWWLKHRAGFATECPRRPRQVPPELPYYWGVSEAGGPPFELYPMVRGGTSYDHHEDKQDLLIELLASLASVGSDLLDHNKEIAQPLTTRLTSFGVRPHYEGRGESLVDRARQLQVILTGFGSHRDVEAVSEEVIASISSSSAHTEDGQRFQLSMEDQPLRLIHGDLTENNLLVQKDKIWLFDWDNVSIQRSGPFDLAFALARLSRPDRMGLAAYPDSDETSYAAKFLEQCLLCISPKVSERDVGIALEQVRFEFALRMLEYFELLATDPERSPDLAYIRRCNPGRPLAIRKELIGSKPW